MKLFMFKQIDQMSSLLECIRIDNYKQSYIDNQQTRMTKTSKEIIDPENASNQGSNEENYQAKITVNIKVITEDQEGHATEELVEDFPINRCLDDPATYSPIVFKRLLLELKNNLNFSLQNKEVYFYLDKAGMYMNCGIDPINQDIRIRPQDYKGRPFVTIKAKDLGISMVHRLMTFENTLGTGDDKQKGGVDEMAERSKCRRTKERRIGHIIDKVREWRKFYNGLAEQGNSGKKYSLQDAAKQVQISKKSLDDYLFQVRFGQKYKFNFNEHYNDKVGVLRDFVRQKKKNDKVENKQRKQAVKEEEKDD